MPNPKRRHSHARQGKRRAHDFFTAPPVGEGPKCHEKKLPHPVWPKCGVYKRRRVVSVEATK